MKTLSNPRRRLGAAVLLGTWLVAVTLGGSLAAQEPTDLDSRVPSDGRTAREEIPSPPLPPLPPGTVRATSDAEISTPDAFPVEGQVREPEPRIGGAAVEPRQRIGQVVAIGGNGRVGGNQRADDVVVIRGDTVVEGEVDGDVVVLMGKLRLRGTVKGDVVVVVGEAELEGTVRGDVVLVLTEGSVGSTAELRGDLMSVGVDPTIAPGARIAGSRDFVTLGPLTSHFRGLREYFFQGILLFRPFPPRLGWVWGAAGLFLVFHLILAAVLAGPVRQCMETVREQPARAFLFGLLTCVLVGPVSILLSFTVLAPMLIWLAFFAVGMLGRVAVYGAAGAAVGRASRADGLQHPVAAVLVGSLLFYVSYMIPFMGFLVYGLVLPLGVGAVLIRVVEALRKERGPWPGRSISMPMPASGAGSGTAPSVSALAAGSPGPSTQGFSGPEAAGTVPSGMSGEPAAPPPLAVPPPTSWVTFNGAEAVALPRVGFWPRFGATMIDVILVGAVNAFTFGEMRAFWLLLALYHVWMWAWKGTTLGGAIVNLRVVRLDARPMDWQTSIVRALGAVVSLVALGVGFFWASWDSEYQSWHDRIAGTTIVKLDRRVALV